MVKIFTSGETISNSSHEQYESIQCGIFIGAESLLQAYIRQIDPKEFLKICERNFAGKSINEIPSMDALMYISSLIDNKKDFLAEKMLSEYIKTYDTRDIFRFYKVTKLASQKGILDDNIEKALYVYGELKNARNEGLLAKMLEGKKIAIVGSAPSEIGKGHGEEIDSYDHCIRFNNFKILPEHEVDYGSKIDIWARNTVNEDVVDRKDEDFSIIILQSDFEFGPVMYDHMDIMYRDLKQGKKYYSIEMATIKELKIASRVYPISAGFTVFGEILRIKKGDTSSFGLFGFALDDEAASKFGDHYFEVRNEDEIKNDLIGCFFTEEAGFMAYALKKSQELSRIWERRNAVIVNNPKQKGAGDGVIAICEALRRHIPDLEYNFVETADEVTEKPYIVWSVGPDTTDIAMEIIKKHNPDFVFGMKDPYDDADVEEYVLYSKIIDTMGTLQTAKVNVARPDLVYFPDFPPFSMTKYGLGQFKYAPVLDIFNPDLLISIGGADPYTNRDVVEGDIDNLLKLAQNFKENIGGKVAFLTSNRTNDKVIEYLKSKKDKQDALSDFKSATLYYDDKEFKDLKSVYQAFIINSNYFVQTDDSLSMMAELTVREGKLVIYQTLGTDSSTQRRINVANSVVESGNAIIVDENIINSDDKNEIFKKVENSKSLEGVIDRKIARMLYDITKIK